MGFYPGAGYNGDEMTYKSIPSSNIVDISPFAIRSPKTFVMGGGRKTLTQLIKSLFSNNEVGFAYNPNDSNTLYQDAAGTIPVTAAGQDYKIHVGDSVSDKGAFHLIRDIGFGVGVSVWAWIDGTTPVYVNVSQG